MSKVVKDELTEVAGGFKQFILKGNVVDLAIGVVIGASFSSVVSALVKDFITPLIGVIGGRPDFSGLMLTLRGNHFLYGDFLNSLLTFLINALVIYIFVVVPFTRLMARFTKPVEVPVTTKVCPECLSDIPKDAKRCKFCTSVQI